MAKKPKKQADTSFDSVPEEQQFNTMSEAEAEPPVAAPTLSAGTSEFLSVNRAEFLKHIRRLLIGSTDRMVRNGTRRTVAELTGFTKEQVDAFVEESKRVKM